MATASVGGTELGGGAGWWSKKPGSPYPGRMKSSGDTLLEALNPLHPAQTAKAIARIVKRSNFQLPFIRAV